MATEVNAQIRQNSAGTSDLFRNQKIEVASSTLASQKRQELQSAEQTATLSKANATDTRSEQKLDQTVEELSSMVQSLQRELNFSVDDKSGRTVIKVIDSQTDEVIRQIPSEEVIELAQMIDQHAGLLMDAKV